MDEDALDGASLLDTQLPPARRARRKADCCVCCGMRCVSSFLCLRAGTSF